jgi:hypothetical protein
MALVKKERRVKEFETEGIGIFQLDQKGVQWEW